LIEWDSMRNILQRRELRYVFIANVVSMLGSGMNTAAVTWFILQETHSEIALGHLVVLQTLPAVLMLPFTGVIIDREDRRHLLMWLDIVRALVILAVAVLAFTGRAEVWHLYVMNTLVAAGFWMFWPTITALIQELTPGTEFVAANTFLTAGVQGGWLMAGAVVGFVYNAIGLGGILLIDFVTYLISFCCYFAVRKGRHVVPRPQEIKHDVQAVEGAVARFWRELREGVAYVGANRAVMLVGTSWALFIGAMLTQGVVTAPLSERILDGGAVGYGWLNAGWGIGAFASALYASVVIAKLTPRRSVALALIILAVSLYLLPFSGALAVAVCLYLLMGTARGIGGIAISSTIMEMVPPHFMGRVQNTFYFLGTLIQLAAGFAVGAVAHQVSLTAAFAIIGTVYVVAALTAAWPAVSPQTQSAEAD
jgi:DHA3 family macrolide efflux protein-like MFS transporter